MPFEFFDEFGVQDRGGDAELDAGLPQQLLSSELEQLLKGIVDADDPSVGHAGQADGERRPIVDDQEALFALA